MKKLCWRSEWNIYKKKPGWGFMACLGIYIYKLQWWLPVADTLRKRRNRKFIFSSSSTLFILVHLLPAYTQYAFGCGWDHPHTNLNKSGVRIVGPLLTHLKMTPLPDTWADSLNIPMCQMPQSFHLGAYKAAKRYHVKKLPSGCSLPPALPPLSVFGGGGGRASVLWR